MEEKEEKIIQHKPRKGMKQPVQSELFSNFNPPAKPFLRWNGNKFHHLKTLLYFVPSEFNRYYEPFLGGGALFFTIDPAYAKLSDLNSELMNCYKVIKESPDKLCQALSKHQAGEKYYYEVREMDRHLSFNRLSDVNKASRTIYLNQNCFRGLYRLNSMNQFNVAYVNLKKANWLNEKNIQLCSLALSRADLESADFVDALKDATKDDFVYLDPPMLLDTKENTGLDFDKFESKDILRLLDCCKDLDKRGVMWLMTCNAAIKEVFSDTHFKCMKFNLTRKNLGFIIKNY